MSSYVPRRELPLRKYKERGPKTKLSLPNPRIRTRTKTGYCSSGFQRWTTDEISGWSGALTTNAQYWEPYIVAADETQTFIDDTSPKYVETSDIAYSEEVDFSYPAFKAASNTVRKFHFTQGPEVVQSGYFPQGSRQGFRRITYHGNPVFIPYNTMFRTAAAASVYGLCLQHDAILTSISNSAVSLIKSKLLEDQSLMNFRDTFSILTFVAELADLKHLPSLLTKWTRSSHDISDKYLGVSFGVLPFYSDICAILKRLQNLGYEIDRWNEMAQMCEIRSYHITIPIPGLDGNKDHTKTYFGGFSDLGDSYVEPAMKCYYHSIATQSAKARGHVYLIPRAIPESLIGELRSKIWGMDTVLGTGWEILPFSFVVDWFADIGKTITEFEKTEPLLQFRVLSAGYSVQVQTVITSSQGRSYDDADFGALTCTETSYVRVPLDPKSLIQSDHNYGLDFKLLNSDQALLGSALLHQLLKR